jgi:hypothetical protein
MSGRGYMLQVEDGEVGENLEILDDPDAHPLEVDRFYLEQDVYSRLKGCYFYY